MTEKTRINYRNFIKREYYHYVKKDTNIYGVGIDGVCYIVAQNNNAFNCTVVFDNGREINLRGIDYSWSFVDEQIDRLLDWYIKCDKYNKGGIESAITDLCWDNEYKE